METRSRNSFFELFDCKEELTNGVIVRRERESREGLFSFAVRNNCSLSADGNDPLGRKTEDLRDREET